MTTHEPSELRPAAAPPPIPSAAPAPEDLADPLALRARILMLVLPLVGLVAAYLAARAMAGHGDANQMGAAALASFLGLGSTIIFGSAILGDASFVQLTTLQLTVVVLVLNTALCVLFLGSFDLLEKLPWLGVKLARARAAAGGAVRSQPWIRRWATLGVAIFVISPLPGSGSLGGTLVGRIIGLSRLRTFVSVGVANAVVCGVYALSADALEHVLKQSRMTTAERLGLVAATVIVLFTLMRWLVARNGTPTRSEGA